MKKQLNLALIVIFIIGLINSIFFMYGHKLVVDSFQLIERGYLFTQGHLVPFGPRSTNSNMIYGSLISILSGAGLWLTNSPLGIMLVILLFQSLAFLMLVKTQFLRINKSYLMVYTFLFWCSPWRASEVFIWNVSLLFFTSVLFLYSIDVLKREKHFLGTLLHGLSYILSLQVHNSVIIFAPVTLFFLYKREFKLSYRGVFVCVLIFAAMIFPTVYVINRSPEILEYNRSDKAYLFANLVGVGGFIKGVAYWLRYSSLYFGSTTLNLPKVNFADRSFWDQVWYGVKWFFAVSSVFYILFINIKYFKKMPDFLKTLCKVFLCSLMLISAMSPVSFNFWHLYLIYPLTIIPVAFYIEQHKKRTMILVSLGVYFFVYSFISASSSYKHDFDNERNTDYQEQVLDKKEELINKYKQITF